MRSTPRGEVLEVPERAPTFKIQDRDDVREIRAKVTGKLLTLDRALEPALPALLALLDVPVDDVAWQALDSPRRRQLTLDALRRLLLREAREQPLLVIFEDLHWIDGETQALLDGLVDSLGSARLLLLVNYRPGYQHAWTSKTYYSQMRLDALPVESAGALLDVLLGDEPGLGPLKQLLVRRGNPFFLEETIRTLVETRAWRESEAGPPSRTRPPAGRGVPLRDRTLSGPRWPAPVDGGPSGPTTRSTGYWERAIASPVVHSTGGHSVPQPPQREMLRSLLLSAGGRRPRDPVRSWAAVLMINAVPPPAPAGMPRRSEAEPR
jgi:hypothetical protein